MPNTVKKPKTSFNKLRWFLIILYFVINILMIFTFSDPNLQSVDYFLATAFIFVLAVLHGVDRYGKKNMLIFFLITWAVSFTFENLSIATGFPFGYYHYSPSLGMMTVPLIIIFAYFAVGYLSFALAHVLTGQYARKLQGKQVFLVPLIAAFIMVMWDLTIDPLSSTLQGMWVWTNPGAYFGVPVSNFFGWFLVVYIFFQIFALYLSRYDTINDKIRLKINSKPYWSEAALVYGITALGTILFIFFQYNYITIDMALITVFTMIFVALVALVNISNNPELDK
ncbi:carotenoid biosynthesis protein [Methanobacterium formicicum]|uniref:Carotenoid biosynthesis protein n=1 Tax=Methanobacterium formicicum TaxID=2162 RepID=A0A843AWJ3_METFO|nr:carotenoid biosynthesis protein [Methanobacterium formicicum]MBF4475893.1 carotenoid biosynthesis protein [Methanobacterium formicicum]